MNMKRKHTILRGKEATNKPPTDYLRRKGVTKVGHRTDIIISWDGLHAQLAIDRTYTVYYYYGDKKERAQSTTLGIDVPEDKIEPFLKKLSDFIDRLRGENIL